MWRPLHVKNFTLHMNLDQALLPGQRLLLASAILLLWNIKQTLSWPHFGRELELEKQGSVDAALQLLFNLTETQLFL